MRARLFRALARLERLVVVHAQVLRGTGECFFGLVTTRGALSWHATSSTWRIPERWSAAARIETSLSPQSLLRELQRIEAKLGRERAQAWGPRTIDLDLILYGDRIIDEPGLIVPHPRFRERAFVLAPLKPSTLQLSGWLRLDVAGDLHPLAARDRLRDAWISFVEELASERRA